MQSTEAAKPDGAPATEAAYTLKAPEGFDEGVLSKFSEFANGSKVPQEAAQALLDKFAPAMQEHQAQQVKAVQDSWIAATRKEFGDPGSEKLTQTLDLANKGLAKFSTDALQQLLDDTGLREHPEIIRLFNRIGSTISEDKVVVAPGGQQKGSSPTRQPGQVGFNVDTAKSLYDHPTSQQK